MIQLYDSFHRESRDLYDSLAQAGYSCPAVVIHDDGFLPAGVRSPYAYFCQMEKGSGSPLYFNQVPVPHLMEITGTNQKAEVWDYTTLRATIFYTEPQHLRLVKNVDWLDLEGRVCCTDHYNQYGWLYARTYFSSSMQATIKKWYSQDGEERIVEHFLTGDILLHWQGQTHLFENRVAFLRFYLEEADLDISRIWYNSLSTPFFLSHALEGTGQDILFWQEPITDHIPGNMEVLLASATHRTQQIVVQDRQTYHKICRLLPEDQLQKVTYLGYIYQEKRSYHAGKDIFIFTYSDQIEQLAYLTEVLSDYTFHIAALTEMSHHLLAFDDKENVHLYPSISRQTLAKLYKRCTIYLDINHGDEVMKVIRTAFEHNLLLFAFDNTVHDASFILSKHILSQHAPTDLVAAIRTATEEGAHAVARQRLDTCQEQPAAYRALLGEGYGKKEE